MKITIDNQSKLTDGMTLHHVQKTISDTPCIAFFMQEVE